MSLPPFLVKAEGAAAAEFHKETQVVTVYLHNALIGAAQDVVNDLHAEIKAYKNGQVVFGIGAFAIGIVVGYFL